MTTPMIDPFQYGQLVAQVAALDNEVHQLRADVRELLELANRSKGGFWFGMSVVSGLSAFAGFAAEYFFRK